VLTEEKREEGGQVERPPLSLVSSHPFPLASGSRKAFKYLFVKLYKSEYKGNKIFKIKYFFIVPVFSFSIFHI